MVIATALDKPAFKNLVEQFRLAEDGKKMSKRLKNYTSPTIIVDKHGADALRLYLIDSPVVRAESLKFKDAGVEAVLRNLFLLRYNAFRLFFQNVDVCKKETGKSLYHSELARSSNLMDFLIEASLHNLIKYVHQEMAAYRLYTVVPALVKYIEQLTKWYVRLNRSRLKGSEGVEDVSTIYFSSPHRYLDHFF